MTAERRVHLNTRAPFRRAEALCAGIGAAELPSPQFRRLIHGVYISTAVPPTRYERERAVLHVAHPDAILSHHTAAQLWGGSPPEDNRVHITVPEGVHRNQRKGVTTHRGAVDQDVRTYRGMRVASPARCFCELASDGVGIVDLVLLGDSLVRAKAVTTEELVAAADEWTGRRAASASRAARLVRDGVDSPMETRIRMLIVLAGLPEPVVNFIVRHENGDWQLRFDLSYPDLMILVEYDGDQHLSPRQRAVDLERRELLQELGWRIVTVQKAQYYGAKAEILRRVATALRARGVHCRIRATWASEFAA